MMEQFNKHPEYGILGVAGSSNLTEIGSWRDGKY